MNERFGFYAVPGDFSVAQSKVFRSGRIYGMDVSSGAAVAALLSDHAPDLRVLDLCCSPRLKLCMIADLLLMDEYVDNPRSPRYRSMNISILLFTT